MTEAEARDHLDVLGVSRETQDRLAALRDLVIKWNRRINLVSPDSLADIWSRHIVDSAQLAPLGPAEVPRWADLGSGGGFPGLVIALLRQDLPGPIETTLVESDQRKCAFLRTAARELGLDIDIQAGRIESQAPAAYDVVSARALAPLDRLLELSVPYLAPGGRLIFPKGARVDAELTSARKRWHMEVETRPSLTEAKAALLVIRKATRRHDSDG